MKKLIDKKMPKGGFLRAVSVLVGGTAGSQVVLIATSPILTRLYTPSDFGILAVFVSIIGILGVIASLRYELAIPLPRNDDRAINVLVLSVISLILLTTLLSIIIWLFGNDFLVLINSAELGSYLWLLPAAFALMGGYQILQYWSLRYKDFGLIAKTKILQSTSTTVLQMAGSVLGPLALIGGRVIGQLLSFVMMLRGPRHTISSIKANVSAKNIWSVAKEYKQFPLFSSWAGLLNASGAQIPSLFFAAVYGPAAAGGYMLAQRIINMPLTVIGSAVSDVFLPSSIAANRDNRLASQVQQLFSALASLIFPSAILLFFTAPDLFQVIFGKDWRVAGEIVSWLAPMLAIQFLVNPVSRIFITIERQDLALLFQTLLLTSRFSGLTLAYVMNFSLIQSVIVFSFASVLGYFSYMLAISSYVGIRVIDIVGCLLSNIFGAIALTVIGSVFYIFELFNVSGILVYFLLSLIVLMFNLSNFKNENI
ncbi:oligosaccharide flippase family protein [Salinivibrio sp. ML290]|uniref:oligosaccharide flippase family protein n=1 Tax=Salinivibrio sp. ML290 TaxID=1909468 RepID=UPI00098836EF|nr:oligosaccharide flippase family protein [Salinivibrio sp. ML290]OOE73669.1 hypothetical protein BZG23_11250 [Salinivibrio sp. ML290]